MKPTEKKALVLESISTMKSIITPTTKVFLDERAKSPTGTSTNFKVLIVDGDEIKNISTIVANACCLRATKHNEIIVKGVVNMADSLKAAISSVVFGDSSSLDSTAI